MASFGEFGSLRHLAGRLFGALIPVGPRPGDARWAEAQLLGGERTLWLRMSPADRRHAVGVARRAVAELDGPGDQNAASRDVVAAALLHDVGKVEAALGTWARVAVTLAAMAAGREQLAGWSGGVNEGDATEAPAAPAPGRRPWRQRIGLYLSHDRVGADLLSKVGSGPLTVAWAGEHHLPPQRWSVDARVGAALKLADDD